MPRDAQPCERVRWWAHRFGVSRAAAPNLSLDEGRRGVGRAILSVAAALRTDAGGDDQGDPADLKRIRDLRQEHRARDQAERRFERHQGPERAGREAAERKELE